MFLALTFGEFVWWVIIGLIAGALGRLIMPGRQKMNLILTILLGVAGAFVGGYIASALSIGGGGTFSQILIATGGAVVLLIVGSFLMKLKK
ncbi:MAG: GlsB/YeaQ/YmgE family stress response membrane protein [Verrucomicrobiota bacterium]